MIAWLPDEADDAQPFPPLEYALREPNGLLAAGGDLSPRRLIAAYERGIFPWFSPGDPILWWSPDPRLVLVPSQLVIRRSLAKVLRNAEYRVRLDSAFDDVTSACATAPRNGQTGTWITGEMRAAYGELHRLGIAHSVETWRNNELIGGLYGVAIGGVFFGESMFSRANDASKIALAHLCVFLAKHGFGIIDCQMETPHLASLGAHPISRHGFVRTLGQLRELQTIAGPWPTHAIDGHFRRRGMP